MTDKTEVKTKTGVVARKRGVSHNGEHYANGKAIELPEHQFNDWEKVGIVAAPESAAQAKGSVPVNNARKPAADPAEGGPATV